MVQFLRLYKIICIIGLDYRDFFSLLRGSGIRICAQVSFFCKLRNCIAFDLQKQTFFFFCHDEIQFNVKLRMLNLHSKISTSVKVNPDEPSFCDSDLKARCHTRFHRAFTACCFVFTEITLVDPSQRNYCENANACSKRTLKTRVATRFFDRMRFSRYVVVN